ncbi:MAG TPA: tyrosine-type recombinase/integrase, partial [Methanocorpusculum sp.]|nr:tyrosine-type recombinase/integrase [Methanocorpusculum sp.]
MLTEEFHSSRSIQYGQNLLQTRVNKGTIDSQEQELILKFMENLIAHRESFGGGRYVDYISTLTHFRRALYITKPWYLLEYDDIISAIAQYRKTPIRRFNYRGDMEIQQKKYSTNSLKQKIRIIRLFLQWLSENKIISIPVSDLLKIKIPTYTPHKIDEDRVYSEKMIAQLVEPAPLMLKAMIWTHYETGTRADEICDLRWKDIQWRNRSAVITIRVTKTNQELQRTAHISMNSVSQLLAWRNEYPGDPTGENYVWLNQEGKPLKYNTYERKLKDLQFTH